MKNNMVKNGRSVRETEPKNLNTTRPLRGPSPPSRSSRETSDPLPLIPNRVGKIALLPDDLREQLNLRMAEGEGGQPLLDWLNSLPQTKKILQRHYDGQPVNKQNLSDWRRGGYAEWRLRDDLMEQAAALSSQAFDLQEAQGKFLAEDLTAVFTARYAALLLRWDGRATAEFDTRLRLYSRMRRDILRLQQSAHETARLHREWKALEQEDTDELLQRGRDILALPEDHPVRKQFIGVRSNGDSAMLRDFLENVQYTRPIEDLLPQDLREKVEAKLAAEKVGRKAKRAAAAQRKAARQASAPQPFGVQPSGCPPQPDHHDNGDHPSEIAEKKETHAGDSSGNSQPETHDCDQKVKAAQNPSESPQPTVPQSPTTNPPPSESSQVKPLFAGPNPPPQNSENHN